ncbi:Regulatory protein MsrR [Streptomyces sp. ADI96-02]|uniref:LCP family protein n=1 Tax=unclassified Streptomyces TaxID=2593676 RepID=UPI000F54E2CF|nr:LCP family protein [Streptomyces sp. ADI96-02]RPK54116.1 Regulatory protein MsrR [Streptomyces sp. ADI96-02]
MTVRPDGAHEAGRAPVATDPPVLVPPAPPGARRSAYGWRGTESRRRGGRRGRPRRRRRVIRSALALAVALALAAGGTYAWAAAELNQEVDLGAYGNGPAAGKGTNYLIVGSDSRDGLSASDVRDLRAGGGGGRRTDSIMVLHTGVHGSVMVSLPRDSWVTIPGFHDPATGKRVPPTRDKLNAAFAYGGPELLAHTVERNTGLRIDHYAEIGFAGFVKVVDAVGGVPFCLDRDIKDEKSGADLRRGCRTLNGRQSLAFVRQRHQEADGDIGRSRNQQRFLAALAREAAASDTYLDPLQLYRMLDAGLGTLVVDRDMDLERLAGMFRSLRGSGGTVRRVSVPVDAVGLPTSKGHVIRWDADRAAAMFRRIRADEPVTDPGGRTA